eukprot:110540_1
MSESALPTVGSWTQESLERLDVETLRKMMSAAGKSWRIDHSLDEEIEDLYIKSLLEYQQEQKEMQENDQIIDDEDTESMGIFGKIGCFVLISVWLLVTYYFFVI